MFESKRFYIAGVKFHRFQDVAHLIKEGDFLEMAPEPDNQYDPNAVKLIYAPDGVMLGYVPKKFSSDVAAAFEIGTDLECEVVKIDLNAKPWERCEVEVREMSSEVEPGEDLE